MYTPGHNLKNEFVTEMQLAVTKWNLLWSDKSEHLSFSRVLNRIAFASVITTKKKNIWLRKLLHLCSTKARHFKNFDCPETEGINIQKVAFFIHVRVLISDDGPMLQIREVTEGSNNT